ncbi:phenylacetate-CoA oxygenase subunit PaaB [Pseudomonas putida S11]|nr:phenylacetate-CoA oxygenase subunit PaaB [Pseudomonas putida S11]
MSVWTLYEVFVRSKHGLNHKHVGSVHAADAAMAIENARELYTRRSEGVSLWVVPSALITASSPGRERPAVRPCGRQGLPPCPASTNCPTKSDTCEVGHAQRNPLSLTCCCSATVPWCRASASANGVVAPRPSKKSWP